MKNLNNYNLFYEYIKDIISDPLVLSMKKYKQHANINCFEHSIYVAFVSFRVCERLGFDSKSASRGGILHDFFLYDWHAGGRLNNWHGFTHPKIALNNASKYFDLNNIEKDIIEKHMWPLTIKRPKYKEALVVCLVDTY